jgi:hypothetical protein
MFIVPNRNSDLFRFVRSETSIAAESYRWYVALLRSADLGGQDQAINISPRRGECCIPKPNHASWNLCYLPSFTFGTLEKPARLGFGPTQAA